MPDSCLYKGEVVHRRYRPVQHALRYRVFNLFADVDALDALDRSLWLFGYNNFGLFTVRDRDHGPGDGTPVSVHAWSLVRQHRGGAAIRRIFMFCYPAVLGYVFNPLTVYYCFDGDERLGLMIYEVNNTFGGRHSYVIPVGDVPAQQAAKRFFVSPFNAVEGEYGFRFSAPSSSMALGITLTVKGEPLLKAYVSGDRLSLNDRNLLRAFFAVPLLTMKVTAAIHLEALRLWFKGLRPVRRPATAAPAVDFICRTDGAP